MSMIWILITILIILILLFGHYGLPEDVDITKYTDFSSTKKNKLLEDATPIFLTSKKKNDKCCLLIHGYGGSPFTFKELSNILHKQGYDVIVPLLPGHGLDTEDFITTRYEHWYNYIKDIYLKYYPQYSFFYIIGFSLGGNLALKLAAEFSKKNIPKKIITIASPIKLYGFLNGKLLIQDLRLILSGILKEFIDHIPRKINFTLKRSNIAPWVGYTSKYTLPCIHSVKINIAKVSKVLKNITSPYLGIHNIKDKTVPIENFYYILRHIGSPSKKAEILYLEDYRTSNHLLLTHTYIKEKIFGIILKYLKEV